MKKIIIYLFYFVTLQTLYPSQELTPYDDPIQDLSDAQVEAYTSLETYKPTTPTEPCTSPL